MKSLAATIAAGQGEMARLIRTKDWAKTPLGPMESWPQSLRTAVSICLGSRHPIVLWWGPERTMIYNDSYRPMLGATKHPQFLGGSGRDCWADVWNVIGPMMTHVLETGEATWSEDLMLVMDRSGYLEETYFTFSYSPIRDENGEPKGIFNACSETTTRVLSERRLRTLRAMVFEARSTQAAAEQCARILERNPRDIPLAALYLVDEATRTLHLAAACGTDADASVFPPSVDLEREDKDTVWPLATVARHGRAVRTSELARRCPGLPVAPWACAPEEAMVLPVTRPGAANPSAVLVLAISPRRVFDDDYEGFFQLVAGHVATALANASAFEEERARAEELAELDRAKTRFFGNVSHELRTPLTLILGPTEDALASEARRLEGRELEVVHHNAVRLLRLVNTLLAFARAEAGRLDAHFVRTDLASSTAALASSFQPIIERAGLRFDIDCPPLPHPVYVDPEKWETIVLNLLSNAFKFTREGGIRVRLRGYEGAVVLSVEDTGVGIPAADLPHVFERFQRVEGSEGRSYEGTGIGLSLVDEFARLHGGHVSVKSELGRGSTFEVSIPVGLDHLPRAAVGTATTAARHADVVPYLLEAAHWIAEPAGGDRRSSSGTARDDARVLVVEDNPEMRGYLERILSGRWNVTAAADGEEALAIARRARPDLVLSDIMMPRKDGVSLLRDLRADPNTKDVPVVLLSARAGEEALVSGLETGADDYLVKPFSARELVARVRTHLELARSRRAWAMELAEATRVNEAKTNFLRLVSHELRTPLAALKLQLARLAREQRNAHAPDVQSRIVDRMHTTTTRLAELVESVLSYARIERGTWLTTVEEFDLVRVVRDVVEEQQHTVYDKLIDVRIRVSDEPILVSSDPHLVRLIATNLVGNALKFTTRGRVTVSVAALAEGVRLVVDDTGPGIALGAQSRVFEPFEQLEHVSSKHLPGVGLGLTLVKEMTHALGGRVELRSAPGRGATFVVTLPATTPCEAEDARRRPGPRPVLKRRA